jgi:hypothetical protein
MKKLSVFMALCIILSSCTKTVDVFVKIIKEDVSVPGKKYKVPVEINLTAERSAAYFEVKKQGIATTYGEWKWTKGRPDITYKEGGDAEFVLSDWSGPDEPRTELGRAVVHIKFNKGVDTRTDISGTGTWTFGKIEGTLTKYLSEGEGHLTYKYDYQIDTDPEFRYPEETILLKGLMKK